MKYREILPLLKNYYLKHLPVIESNKSYIRLAISILIDETMIFTIICIHFLKEVSFQIGPNIVDIIYYALCGLRIVLALCFLVFKKHQLIMANKVTIYAFMFLLSGRQSKILIGVVTALIQIISRTVWVLVQDQRFSTNPIQGRLGLFYVWIRELTFVMMGELYSFQADARIYAMSILVFIRLWCCFEETIYNLKLRNILKSLELGNLVIVLFMCFLSDKQYLVISIPLILIIFASGFIQKSYCDQLIRIEKNFKKYKNQEVNSNGMYDYLLILNYLLYKEDYNQLNRFVSFHLQQCNNPLCRLNQMKKRRLQQSNQWQKQSLIQFCRLYLQTVTFSVQVKQRNFTNLKIFLNLPSMRVYKYLKQENWVLCREIDRIKNQYKVTQNNVELNVDYSEQINKKVEKALEKLCWNYEKLFKEVNKKQMNYSKILYAFDKIECLKQKIKQFKTANNFLTSKSRFLLNQIFSIMIRENKLEDLNIVQRLMVVGEEVGLTLVASAEVENFGKILNANKETVRWLYVPKSAILTLQIDNLVPPDMKVVHRQMLMRKKDQVTAFNISIDFPQTLYITNAQGYILPFTAVVRRFCSIEGRKWHLVLYPAHVYDPVMIVGLDGTILGVNEVCISYGFDKSMINQPLPSQFYRDIIRQGNEDIPQPTLKYQQRFSRVLKLKKIQQHKKIKKYYVVEIVGKDLSKQTEKTDNQQRIMKQNSKFEFKANREGHYLGQNIDTEDPKQVELLNLNNMGTSSRRQKSKLTFIFKPNQIDIQQLILYQGKIDHKKNVMLRQQDTNSFQIVNKAQQKWKKMQISQQLFLDKLKLQQKNKPCWLISFSIFLGVTLALLISLKVFTLIYHLDNVNIVENQNKAFILFNEQLNYYTQLGMLPILSKHLPNLDYNTTSKKKFIQIQLNWKQLEILQPHLDDLLKNNHVNSQDGTISNSFKGLLEDYTIFVRDYSINPQQSAMKRISNYLDVVNKGFINVIDQMNSKYNKQFESNLTIYIILKFILALLVLAYCGFILIQNYRSANEKNQVLDILSKLKPEDLKNWIHQTIKIIRLVYFTMQDFQQKKKQQRLEKLQSEKSFSKSSRSFQKLVLEKKIHQIKKAHQQMIYLSSDIIKSIKRVSIYCSTIILLIATTLIWQNLYSELMQKINQSNNFKIQFSLISSMYRISSSYLMIEKGVFYTSERQKRQSKFYFADLLDNLQVIDYIFQKGIQKQCFTQQFTLFYDQFWEGNSCKLIAEKNCPKDFSGAARQGVSTLFSQIMRLQYYLSYSSEQRDTIIKKMSEIVHLKDKYLQFYIKLFLQQMIDQYLEQREIWRQNSIQLFTYSWIYIAVVLGIGVIIMIKNWREIKIMDKGLTLFYFQDLIKIPVFNKKINRIL